MAKPNVITKRELLDAAKRCLAENGLEKTTLKAVADQANVSQGTVFYHFRTKEQLMMELVQSLCDDSWQSLQQGQRSVEEALQSAKERCGYDSVYHRLFFTTLAASLQQPSNRERLNAMMQQENEHLTDMLASRWEASPIGEIPMNHWGIMLNALIDGLAVQALLDEDFPKESVFESLRHLFKFLAKEGVQ
ncbi:TetR/AcrR family transcriptional regulator [Paenibacillus thailandensis]|uniref:TetR/AcrR family transcriptional regulator n=1 Tax=Paenibacillus thailandensis TaxID=393250 RepID=A0ABW5QY49_9BACL